MKLKSVKAIVLYLAFISSISILAGCSLWFGQKKQNNTVILKFETELPEEYKFSTDQEKQSRNATPGFGNLIFDITASNGVNIDTVTLSGVGQRFNLPLKEGTWNVEVKAYSVDSNNKRNNSILFKGNLSLTVSLDMAQNTLFKVPLFLNSEFDEGKGQVELKVSRTSDADIAYAKWKIGTAETGTLDFSNVTEATLSAQVNSGNHSLTILFYNQNDYLVYSINTIVTVYSENITDVWRTEDEIENKLNYGTNVLISKEMLEEYQTSTFFVGKNSGDEEGTISKPFKNIKRALTRISQINDGSSVYKIYICNEEDDEEPLEEAEKSFTLNNSQALKLKLEAFEGTKNRNQFDLALDFNNCAAGSSVLVKNLTLKKKIQSNSAAVGLINCTVPEVKITKNASIDINGDVDIPVLYLGTTTESESGNQIRINVNGSIAGSSIGILTYQQLNFDRPSIIFTEGFTKNNKDTTESSIFTSVENKPYAVGILDEEAAIGLSLLEFTPSIIENVLFALEAEEDSEVEVIFDPSENAHSYIVEKEKLTNATLYLQAYSADGNKTPISDSLVWNDVVVTCEGSSYGLDTILSIEGNCIQFMNISVPAGKYEIFGEAIYKAQNAHTGGTVYLEIK